VTSIGAMIRREIAPEDEVAHAQFLAERFDEIWIVEDLPFAGGISQLAMVLAATEDVVVGHGIAPAPFRNPAALAMEWGTLERMFPGRVRCGLGVLSGQVVDSAHGWSVDGGVVSMMVVGVEEVVKGGGSFFV